MHVRASELRGQVDGDTRGYWDLLVTGWGGKKKKTKGELAWLERSISYDRDAKREDRSMAVGGWERWIIRSECYERTSGDEVEHD